MSDKCSDANENPCQCNANQQPFPMAPPQPHDDGCCGTRPAPESHSFEKPGYSVCRFVEDFKDTSVGKIPQIKTQLDQRDYLGAVAVRIGIGRNDYRIAPGLYSLGNPKAESPVLVTANYKLTFDTLRRELKTINAWILVLDTRGVNVWCAAGKKTFSTDEVIRRVQQAKLADVVSHRRLILPQLSATGVSGRDVKKGCGFRVIWGPIRASDIQSFIKNGMQASLEMRRVQFTLWDRFILAPVELWHLPKPTLWLLLIVFVLSGIGSHVFSFTAAWTRGIQLVAAYIAGILAGALAAPVLLPWIPGKAFALKGGLTGVLAGLIVMTFFWQNVTMTEAVALIFFVTAVSSYLTMNFTGSTPFTSPSGVEKEMRRAIPLQLMAIVTAAVAWVGSAFIS